MGARYQLIGVVGAALGAAVSCGAPQARCLEPATSSTPVAESPVTPAPETSAQVGLPQPVPERGTRCWAKGRPAPPVVAVKEDEPFCHDFDARLFSTVEADVRKEFVITSTPSRLVVDFGCDVAGEDVTAVYFEDGSGHGGTLRLVRLAVGVDRVDVRVIRSSHYHRSGIELSSGTIDKKAFEKVLARSRIALLARPHLIRLVVPGKGMMRTIGGSTNDFHLRLTIVDRDGRVTDRGLTGYAGASGQEDTIPMELAAAPLAKLIEKATLTPSRVTHDDREFFTARFNATMAGDPYWWVAERYVANAAALGTIDVMPALLETLRAPAGASADRTRELALGAIESITGWDPRVDGSGGKRTVADAVTAALEECVLAP